MLAAVAESLGASLGPVVAELGDTAVAVDGLRSRGWLSGTGEATITDELDALAYVDLSDDEVARLVELAAVVGEAVAAAVVRPAPLGGRR